jgi:RNA polymerase sigma-70 factor, ECF subfamily
LAGTDGSETKFAGCLRIAFDERAQVFAAKFMELESPNTLCTVERPTLTDEEYVRGFREAGDNRCFAELFVRHRTKVFFACQRFFSDAQRAEDATQEAFLRAYRRIQTFQGGDFVGWLMRIAKNVCIDEWRRGRLDPVTGSSELAEREAPATLDSSFDLQEKVDRIWQEIKSLSPEQRQCLELKIEGFSYEETSARTGFSVDAVKSYLQNGRRMLWKRMEGALSESK